jgi:hypothetical protein
MMVRLLLLTVNTSRSENWHIFFVTMAGLKSAQKKWLHSANNLSCIGRGAYMMNASQELTTFHKFGTGFSSI